VDARSDIFSLGVMLYRAAVGRLPFEGEGLATVLGQIISQEPVAPREAAPPGGELPEALERMIVHAMRKDPAERYPSVDAMLAELRAIEAAIAPPAPAPVARAAAPRPSRRGRMLAAGAASAVALGLAVYLVLAPGSARTSA